MTIEFCQKVYIYITPPENDGENTDCDSGDEEDTDPNHLSTRQLRAEGELMYSREDRRILSNLEDNIEGQEEGNSVDNESQSVSKSMQPPRKKTKTEITFQWEKGDMNRVISPWSTLVPPLTLSKDSHPVEFFQLFMSQSLVEDLVKYTVNYATQKNVPGFELSSNELYVFIGILLVSGYVPLPRRRMFWEEAEDVHNILVSQSMRRNRFEEISRFFHAADNSALNQGDKMAKLRPIIDSLNKKFIQYAPLQPNISIDESMIPYYGKHGCKQFIRSKPIRFGYKAWVMATKPGYCLQFEIYQGRKNKEITNECQGLGESVVLNFTDVLQREYSGLRFSLYFDNFFTSAKLISTLTQINFGATGTVRENRTMKCKLNDSNIMKKEKRGNMDSAVDKNKGIIGIKWKDNSVVTVMSNEFGVEPLQKCKRFSVKDKKKVDIPQPHAIKMYNTYMGGVDQLDNNISNYRIAIRGKKWYTPILYWMIDLCVANASQLAREYGYDKDNLQFRREISQHILKKYGVKPKMPGPKRSSLYCVTSEGPHLIVCQQARRRCSLCKNKTTKACETCQIPLHDKCFDEFHKI